MSVIVTVKQRVEGARRTQKQRCSLSGIPLETSELCKNLRAKSDTNALDAFPLYAPSQSLIYSIPLKVTIRE